MILLVNATFPLKIRSLGCNQIAHSNAMILPHSAFSEVVLHCGIFYLAQIILENGHLKNKCKELSSPFVQITLSDVVFENNLLQETWVMSHRMKSCK